MEIAPSSPSKAVDVEQDLLQKHLHEKLICPICCEMMFSRINQCRNGHIICDSCLHTMQVHGRKCPECRVPMEEPCRSLALEQLAATHNFVCPYESCSTKVKYSDMCQHKQTCDYRPVPCRSCHHLEPFTSWEALWEHCQQAHFKTKREIGTSNQREFGLFEDCRWDKNQGNLIYLPPDILPAPDDGTWIRFQLIGVISPNEKHMAFAVVEFGPPSGLHYCLEICGLYTVVYPKFPILSYRTSYHDLKNNEKCVFISEASLLQMTKNFKNDIRFFVSLSSS